MHTTTYTDPETGTEWIFNHNGDYSGDVIIGSIAPATGKRAVPELTIPFKALKELVAGYVRDEKVSFYEDASANHVLDLMDDD